MHVFKTAYFKRQHLNIILQVYGYLISNYFFINLADNVFCSIFHSYKSP